ncbi:Conserved hypothetical protein [Candidatus Protochlamydia naegleriophila]|uniref:Peptidase M16 C-terminal domain-containing protein n=1 Tax=Candidatus Protochlamydia naegleriophila TaxID=389348 RepID=A0A0U5JAL1_9BACT|nr:insulinase family protein [Candidatus Protochlamydia naegleriophila]CUI16167.1 Conserved hypothetical protein [Candidatus Protochlamydia naegleriophila]
MKPHSFLHKLITSLTLGLTACQPFMHAAKAPQLLSQNLFSNERSSLPSPVSNRLSNGLIYTLVPTHQKNSHLTVKLGITMPPETDTMALALLIQHTLFHGTKELTRSMISEQLNQLGLDVDADNLVKTNELEHSIQVSLPAAQESDLTTILTLIQQIAFEPTLSPEAIERARLHLLQSELVTNDQSLEENQTERSLSHQIASITQEQVKTFYAKWYKPSIMNIAVSADNIAPAVEEQIEELFSSYQESQVEEDARVRLARLLNQPLSLSLEDTSQLNSQNETTNPLLQHVDFISQDNIYVVDGKIWMNPPNWINKSANGRLFGAALTALGIGSLLLTPIAPFALPVLVAMGSLSTVTGVYFMSCNYLKDPDYVSSKRKEDLAKGFEHAYRNHRAGVTLTPQERRYLFLQGMIHYPATLSKAPIVLLADLYDLTNPLLSELFLVEELSFLIQSKLYFTQNRNQYKILMDRLDQELLNMTAPYAAVRDNNLAHAQNLYYHNPFVTQKRSLQMLLEDNIELIEKAYQKHEISIEDRDQFIAEHKQAFQESLKDAYLAAGLAQAEATLMQMEHEALIAYDYQVAQCKLVMQYDLRMAQYKNGKQALILECDIALRNGLANFPLSLPSLPDFVDLR